MPISVSELLELHPRLYHMTDEIGWNCIQSHGLLSTSALLNLFGVKGAERRKIESEHRPKEVTISKEGLGKAVIRDQKAMRESCLKTILTNGLSPTEWYRILNRKVFFWVSETRVERFLCAKAYRDREHRVLEIDTAKLLKRHLKSIRLCPYNSGATFFKAPARGLDTFQCLDSFPFECWRTKRKWRRACVVELAVECAVPDVLDFVVSAEVRSCKS